MSPKFRKCFLSRGEGGPVSQIFLLFFYRHSTLCALRSLFLFIFIRYLYPGKTKIFLEKSWKNHGIRFRNLAGNPACVSINQELCYISLIYGPTAFASPPILNYSRGSSKSLTKRIRSKNYVQAFPGPHFKKVSIPVVSDQENK